VLAKLLGYWNMIASLGSKWLQKLKCVITKTTGLFLWLQKGQKETEPVCDCNYVLCVIANNNYVWLQKKKTWLCLWLKTWLGYLEYDCKPG
jgi:hypothetical protein